MATTKKTEFATPEFAKANNDAPFKMGDAVSYKDTLYHVVGMALYLGYDIELWTYTIAKPTYGSGFTPWGHCRMDINMVKDVKFTDLKSLAQYEEEKRKKIADEIAKLESELKELRGMI